MKYKSSQLKNNKGWTIQSAIYQPAASFTKEVNLWLAKRPLETNGRLANRGLTSLVKE